MTATLNINYNYDDYYDAKDNKNVMITTRRMMCFFFSFITKFVIVNPIDKVNQEREQVRGNWRRMKDKDLEIGGKLPNDIEKLVQDREGWPEKFFLIKIVFAKCSFGPICLESHS